MTTSPAKDIQEYLVAQGFGESGVDLFYHKLPGDVKKGIAVRDSGGFDPDKTLLKSESVSRPTVQFFARGTKYAYDQTYSDLADIANHLDQLHEIELNSKRYISFFQVGEILDLGENTSENPELSLNFMMEVIGA